MASAVGTRIPEISLPLPAEESLPPKWKDINELTEWVHALRQSVKTTVDEQCGCIQGAKNIFRNLGRIYYSHYFDLNCAMERILDACEKFQSQELINAEFLREQEFLRDSFNQIPTYMRTPRGASIKYRQRMETLRTKAKAVAINARTLWVLVEKTADQLNDSRYQSSSGSATLNKHDQGPDAPLKHANGEGFREFEKSLQSHMHQDVFAHGLQSLKLRCNWEVHRAMPLFEQAVDFSSIITINGREDTAQAATVGDYLKEHFTQGHMLLTALQGAWDSNSQKDMNGPIEAIKSLSLWIEDPEKKAVAMEVLGSKEAVIEVAVALAWFCAAIRPLPSQGISLSTFHFAIEDTGCANLPVTLTLGWGNVSGVDSCWHRFFTRVMIVEDAPIANRTEFGSPFPAGLELDFNLMAEIALVDYPFEHHKGLALKGFSTILAVTRHWSSPSGMQWHFLVSEKEIDLWQAVDSPCYHVWEPGNAVSIEAARDARTFVGWADTFQYHISEVDPHLLQTADLNNARGLIELKSATVNASLAAKPATLGFSLAFGFQKNSLQRSQEANFNEIIVSDSSSPILVYSPAEERGWIVPKLQVMELMISLHFDTYGFDDILPPANLDLSATGEKLLEYIQRPELRLRIANDYGTRITTFHFRDLVKKMSTSLDLVANCNHFQQRPRITRALYGLNLYNLAMRDATYHVKKCPLTGPKPTWWSLLRSGAVRGAFFTKGLPDIMIAESCETCRTLPNGKKFVAIAIRCLWHLKKRSTLPKNFFAKAKEMAFERSGNCPSFRNHVQSPENEANNIDAIRDHPDGIVVYGEVDQG